MKTCFLCVAIFLLLGGCEDFIVKNIEKKAMLLTAPADGIQTPYGNQTFVWEEVAEATGYRLVIVTPGFEHTALYLLDTLVEGHLFSYVLPAGHYQWRVRAENSEYHTGWTCRSLVILPEDVDKTERDGMGEK